MTVPVGKGLFGECRIAGKCTCGLCSRIEFGHQSERGRPKAIQPKPKPTQPTVKSIQVEIDKAAKKLKAKANSKPRKPRQTFLHGDPVTTDPCGCKLWRQRRIKWCRAAHTPHSHPNPCQHEHRSVQNFGLPTQKSVCLHCSNDISG